MEFFTIGVYNSTEQEYFNKLTNNNIDTFLPLTKITDKRKRFLIKNLFNKIKKKTRDFLMRWIGGDYTIFIPTIQLDFIERLKISVFEGLTYYIPVCYSTFKNKPVKNDKDKSGIYWTKSLTLNGKNGFWRTQGSGMIAATKRDMTNIGGYNTKDFGSSWGGEDVELATRFIQNGLKPIRTRELNYFHIWHPKNQWKPDDQIVDQQPK
jgi:hypothetical protein